MCFAVYTFAYDSNIRQSNQHISNAWLNKARFDVFFASNQRAVFSYFGGLLEGDGRGRPWAGRRRRPFIPTRIDVFANWSLAQKATWHEAFGFMHTNQIHSLANALDLTNVGVRCMSPQNMVTMFLHRMRSGCRYIDSGLMWGVSKSQASKIFKLVLKRFVTYFKGLIRWPSPEEEARCRRKLRKV